MPENYIYGSKIARVEKAEGVTGMLIRGLNGYKFRVYREDDSFTDYDLRHDDLSITIDQDALASFYVFDEETAILDHSPSVLGLSPSVLE